MATVPDVLAEHRPSDAQLRYLGAALTYLVAGVHLFHPQHGFPRLALLLGTGSLGVLATDPRPLLFVLSGLALLAGVKLVLLGWDRRPIYVAGMVLMAIYVLGYVAWHLSGHGGFLPTRQPNYHDLHPVAAVLDHFLSYPIARVAIVLELALLGVLAVLYWREG